VQRELGYDTFRHPGNAFDAKLKRRLNALAEKGVIIKMSARESLPLRNGQTSGSRGDAHWALPHVATQILAEHTQAKIDNSRAKAALEERTEKLTQWASVHDIDVTFRGDTAVLDLDAFEAILVKLMEVS